MKTIKNFFTYILLNVRTSFNIQYTYRAASVLKFITKIILILASYFLWYAIYQNSCSINNYSLNDMTAYIVISFAIEGLYPSNVSSKFGRMVKDGSIIHSLLKPVPIEFQLFTQSLGNLIYNFIFSVLPIILTGYVLLHVRLNITMHNLLIALLFFISSYIFTFVLEISIGALSYYTQCLWGINNFKSSIISILSGKILPLNFYPVVCREIIFILPFSALYTLPINLLMNKTVPNVMFHFIILLISTLILGIVYSILSKTLIKKIMIQGG